MGLLLPNSARPSNLYAPAGQVQVIDSDVYRICERIKDEVPNGHRLFVVVHLDTPKPFVVMERCDDGVDRVVDRFEALDGRVIQKLRYLIAVPFEKRFAEAERIEAKNDADYKQEQLERLYDELGGPVRRQLWHDGFIEHRGVSYPTRGVKK